MQRQKVLALWRDCVRTIYSKPRRFQYIEVFADTWAEIPKSSDTREEMRSFARDEFERYKHVHDIVSFGYELPRRNRVLIFMQSHIRYLTSTGKTQLDSMRRLVEQNVR